MGGKGGNLSRDGNLGNPQEQIGLHLLLHCSPRSKVVPRLQTVECNLRLASHMCVLILCLPEGLLTPSIQRSKYGRASPSESGIDYLLVVRLGAGLRKTESGLLSDTGDCSGSNSGVAWPDR